MSENRGAKGSIKDRLISMLYRLRYLKKVKKEEEYRIDKKEKQIEYLKKLQELNEFNDVNILDEKDKKELDKVKFNVNIKLNNDVLSYEKDKKGTNIVEFNLSSIEYKTSELDEKVEIKKEIKKTKNEVVILKEVDNFIKKSKEVLDEITTEVESLKNISKDKNKDTKELEERYVKLKEKVDKLKKQYDTVKNKYDLSEFSILESIKLIDNIKDYKSVAALNEMDMMVKVCKKEIDKIGGITLINEKTKKVGTDINEIKNEQKDIKIKFYKSKQKLVQIKEQEEKIDKTMLEQEAIINEMYKEAIYFEKIVREETQYVRKYSLIGSLLNIASGILTLPFTGTKMFGIALGNTLINRGLKKINSGFDINKKIIYEYKYDDISNKLNDIKDKVEYTNLIISDNLNEIIKLKDNFKKYSQYNKILPEYESMIIKINNLEEKLIIAQKKITEMDKKIFQEKKLNEEKMEKVLKRQNKNN